MIPSKTIEELILKHSTLEKDLSSGEIDKKLFAEKSKEYSNLNEIIMNAKKYISYEDDKKDLEKIILCDVQNKIYPNLEKTFLNLIHNSGFPEVTIDKKIDFTELYKQRAN